MNLVVVVNKEPFIKGDYDLIEIPYGNKFKLENIYEALKNKDLSKYDAVWLPDDDIQTTAKNIKKMFKLFKKYNLDLAQPAIKGGKISHEITWKRGKGIRYVNFVEMMCPIFKGLILQDILPLFKSNRSGWGIDFLWSKILKDLNIAILDSTTVIHERIVDEGEYYKRLKQVEVSPLEELQAVINKFKCDYTGRMYAY